MIAPPLVFAVLFVQSPLFAEPPIREVIREHVDRYPELALQDLYKLLHQAALGNRHAAGDRSEGHHWIADESDPHSPHAAVPEIEPLTPDGRLVRINLRPYFEGGGDRPLLDAAFQRTALEFQGSTGQLQTYWEDATQMAEEGRLPFPPAEMRIFFAEMKEQHYPTVHHSDRYRSLYHPSYRVVLRDYLFND